MQIVRKIAPCLWFDDQAEADAQLYTSIFPNSKIGKIARYGEAGREFHGKPPGSVMSVTFELDGLSFTAINGGPIFKFSPAISFFVSCETQSEVDELWTKLCEGGAPNRCGWLQDKFGVSWQISPKVLVELMSDPYPKRAGAVGQAMMTMQKIDIAALERAHAGS